MYNLRYHIASLVGVFLALALGLVLGGLVVQRGTLDRQQGSLVAGLQREFQTLRTDNEELTSENEVLSEFSAMLTDQWIADRLVGKNYIVLTGSGRSDGLQAATSAIDAAGGTPIIVTISRPGLPLDSATSRSLFGSPTAESADVTASIVASLAVEWAGPTTQRPLTDALVEAGALTVEGLEPGMATVGLVNLASVGGRPDPFALALALEFDAREDAAAIGAEGASLTSGVAAASAERDMSAIDTLGTSVGRYSIVALFSGAERGFYGLAPDAAAAFPAPPAD